MIDRTALVTGVTGQDGTYLAQFLLDKGYTVHGLRRPCSAPTSLHIEQLRQSHGDRFIMHSGDVTDASRLIRLLRDVSPDEIYNLAAQSHVQVSFETPKYTANANGLGVLRLLDAVRLLGMERKIRFYQASTSELFGRAHEVPQRETTPFHPRSPYAVAKLFAHWTVINHREAYGMHASNGILFNHESPLRGESFVTRKITRAAAAIRLGVQETLSLGNLDAQRDWGHARDYVEGVWAMLQQDEADDYVLGTGVATSVRTFCEWAFEEVGFSLKWEGAGLEETGRDAKTGQLLIAIDPRYLRPAEVDIIVADPSKAREKLGWSHRIAVRELVSEMVAADLKLLGTHHGR